MKLKNDIKQLEIRETHQQGTFIGPHHKSWSK